MCASVEEVLKTEFGVGLGDPGVPILDPCTGTGHFNVNLMRRIPGKDLPRMYREQLFANEVMLLPYYIAAMFMLSEPMRRSICVLYRARQDGSRSGVATSFFFMEDDLVPTAKHVMEDHENSREPYSLLIRPSQSRDACRAIECVYHIEQDLALIKLEKRYPVTPFRPCLRTEKGFTYVGYNPTNESLEAQYIPKF